jgi:hypothetical protein
LITPIQQQLEVMLLLLVETTKSQKDLDYAEESVNSNLKSRRYSA